MRVVVVGGGVAGAAAACLLGAEATLVERQAGPHDKICGEFISWEAQDALARLGLDLARLGGAAISRVRLAHGSQVVEQALPGRGLGLSRRRLDAALLDLAEVRGARLMRGQAVREVSAEGVEVEGAGWVAARRVLLATGKHDLRGVRRSVPGASLVGFKTHLRLSPGQMAALGDAVEVVMFPGGYAGMQPIEGGLANLCLLMRQEAFAAAGGSWEGVRAHLAAHCPHLAGRLQGSTEVMPRPLAISRVPYGFVHDGVGLPGVLRLGDQMGVIPSFSGDGMAIALHTAFAAVRAEDAVKYHAAMRADLGGQIGRAMALQRMAQAAPGVVSAAARAWPGALAWVARITRVRSARLAWQ